MHKKVTAEKIIIRQRKSGESIHRKYGKRHTMRLSFHGLGRNRLIAGSNVALQKLTANKEDYWTNTIIIQQIHKIKVSYKSIATVQME